MLPFVTILGRSLPMYGLLGLLGFLLGLLFVILRVPRFSLSRDDAAYIYVFAALGALAGAKLLYLLTVLPRLAELVRSGAGAAALLAYVSGGFVFLGAIPGGLAAARLAARAYRVRLADFMPLLVPALALVAALGRVGCFCAGCCYGVECDSPVSVVFPAASLAAPPGVPRLPVQLFEAAVQLALFLALLWFTARPRRTRFAAEFYLACYCPARFVLEFFRGDVARGALWGLSTSQWLSAAGFLAVSLYFFMRSGRKMPD